ncbi:MAG: hypothetical protein R6V31_12220, partial [Halohasta sp.]
IFFGPIMLLGEFIGEEPTTLIYYLLAMGIPLWIIYAVKRVYMCRRSRENDSFNRTAAGRGSAGQKVGWQSGLLRLP